MNNLYVGFVLFITLTHAVNTTLKIPDMVYYGSFAVLFIWLLVRGRRQTLTWLYLPFILAVFCSLGMNEIPSLFRPGTRAVAFLALACTVGPFFRNTLFDRFRRVLFIRTYTVLRWLVILSFLGYLSGLPYFLDWTGNFCGLFNHSMLLGPLSGLIVLYSFYRMYAADNLFSKQLEGGLLFLSALVLILSGSRSALGACLVGVVFFHCKLYRLRPMLLLRVGLVSLLFLAATSTIWWSYTERLRDKMEYGEEQGSVTASRDDIWRDRLAEFKAYPFFGVGFSSYNLEISRGMFNKESGTVEPGSSWLFLLSSMGLMGCCSFLWPVSKQAIALFRMDTNPLNAAFLGSTLFLFLAHMFFEGYVVSSGAYLCFFLWLTLSECNVLCETE